MDLGDINKLEDELRAAIKAVGVSNAARLLGLDKSHISKVASGGRTPTTKTVIEYLEKLRPHVPADNEPSN